MSVGRLRVSNLVVGLLLALVTTKLWLIYREPVDTFQCVSRGGHYLYRCVGADPDWAQRGRGALALLAWAMFTALLVITVRATTWREVRACYVTSPRLRAGVLAASLLAAVVTTNVWWVYDHQVNELFCRVRPGQAIQDGCLGPGTDWAQRGRGAAAIVLWAFYVVLVATEVRIRRAAGKTAPLPVGR